MSVDWIYFNQQDANLQNGTAELPEEYEDVLYTIRSRISGLISPPSWRFTERFRD